MNQGFGIELADEPTVVAAIIQEFMTSTATSGWWEDDLRFYAINREVKYTKEKKRRPQTSRYCH